MAMVVTTYSSIDREEEAKIRRPRTRTLLARPARKKVGTKAFYTELKRRYPSVIKYLAEH